MSKIGNAIISLPEKVEISLVDGVVLVKGPLGSLSQPLVRHVKVAIEDKQILVSRDSENWKVKAAHGLIRALIANMINGVSTGWTRDLEMIGTGYRGRLEGKNLVLSVGYSHPVTIVPPEGIVFAMNGQDKITVKGFDKQLVGETAAKIRQVRPPEPYKGKGIRYVEEFVRRKAGKASKG